MWVGVLIATAVLVLTGTTVCAQHEGHPIDGSTKISMAAEAIGGDCHSHSEQAAEQLDLPAVSAPNPVTDGYLYSSAVTGFPTAVVADSKQQPSTPVEPDRMSLLCISRT